MAEVRPVIGLEKLVYNPKYERVKVEELPELPGPYEIFDPQPGEVVEFTPLRYEFGRMFIRPPWLPYDKWVASLRVWVKPEDKPGAPNYWDINPGRLQLALFPVLDKAIEEGRRIRIRVEMPRPRTHYFVELLS